MMDIIYKLAERAFEAVIVVVAVAVIYAMLVILPMRQYANAECLREGYPVARVTIGLERYCLNMDGDVVIKVKKM